MHCALASGVAMRHNPMLAMLQEENILRKKFFNQMEDMKGKIRVYARVRPMLTFEQQKGQSDVLKIPDELTLEHMWKDKKREYSFDAVFAPETSQDKVTGCLGHHHGVQS